MVEMNLDHIYKKYEGNDKYSVTDMNLAHLAVVSQRHYG